jgi:hypothetical protein
MWDWDENETGLTVPPIDWDSDMPQELPLSPQVFAAMVERDGLHLGWRGWHPPYRSAKSGLQELPQEAPILTLHIPVRMAWDMQPKTFAEQLVQEVGYVTVPEGHHWDGYEISVERIRFHADIITLPELWSVIGAVRRKHIGMPDFGMASCCTGIADLKRHQRTERHLLQLYNERNTVALIWMSLVAKRLKQAA